MDQETPCSTTGASPEIAVVIPTLNELGNIMPLTERLRAALGDREWEVIFVDDDSSDGTIEAIESVCRQDRRFRCIRRIGRRGLSSAVVEGIQSTFAPFVAVMDADLQHDETLLVAMLRDLQWGHAELVVGSRYLRDGGIGSWDSRRAWISRLATRLSRVLLKGRALSDPMSGFFAMRRSTFDALVRDLSVQGYKILLDIITSSSKELQIRELPYIFGTRREGSSKLDSSVVIDFFVLIVDKLTGRWIPGRFIIFATIGAIGFVFHMSVLALALAAGAAFMLAQSVATSLAIAANFFLNNFLTYRDRRLRGVTPILIGLASFYAVCLVGAVANVGIASVMFSHRYAWWFAGLCGVLVGAVWNYAGASTLTWRPNVRRTRLPATARGSTLAIMSTQQSGAAAQAPGMDRHEVTL
ncbi:MAG TPA: glycosyltransferase family 2 protein [Acetobacteraceae bacterium]|jgi:dolichol-phosphate mannosyltransferase|nr:glycosyltransferase family 2 protein [Acetobacteraceae bacterium]